MSPAFWLRVGAVWGFLAISMGAFGAHGLEAVHIGGAVPGGLSAERLRRFSTRVLNTICIAHWHAGGRDHGVNGPGRAALQAAGWLFLLGSLVFSGSLYILAITGLRWLGAITPFGGIAMVTAWVALAVAAGSFLKSLAVSRPESVLQRMTGVLRVLCHGNEKRVVAARFLRTVFTAGALGRCPMGRSSSDFWAAGGNADSSLAFAALVHRHAPMVLGVCRDILPPP